MIAIRRGSVLDQPCASFKGPIKEKIYHFESKDNQVLMSWTKAHHLNNSINTQKEKENRTLNTKMMSLNQTIIESLSKPPHDLCTNSRV